jgi:hypothetical protein
MTRTSTSSRFIKPSHWKQLVRVMAISSNRVRHCNILASACLGCIFGAILPKQFQKMFLTSTRGISNSHIFKGLAGRTNSKESVRVAHFCFNIILILVYFLLVLQITDQVGGPLSTCSRLFQIFTFTLPLKSNNVCK